MPVPYQYSALRTFDNDPDEDVIDPENNLNMMVDDSSSDDEEIVFGPCMEYLIERQVSLQA